MKRFLPLLLALLLLLSACAEGADVDGEVEPGPEITAPEAEPEPTPEPEPENITDKSGVYALSDSGEAIITGYTSDYAVDDNNRVFYEIFVGSFSDSDGDGTGDLRGIINRLDYINDGDPDSGLSLGAEGIWLTPVFESPSYHKYDVADYYAVDDAFGTEYDLIELVEACHERNVKVILDLPINHTSRRGDWFTRFLTAHRQGLTDDEYYDFYSWYRSGEQAPAGRTFAQLSGTDDYYECNFDGGMPELNFDNPLVRDTVLDIAKHWMDLGVDGFRFDAAKYIYFGDNEKSAEFWDWYVGELRKINPEVYTVAEVWDSDGITDRYYPALNCFDFTVSSVSGLIAEAAKAGNVNTYTAYVERYIDRVQAMRGDATIVPFIANHDMDRAAGFLTTASGQMKCAANLLILSPGSPFIYYGEEIGMRGSRGGANTDANRRLAMIWNDGDTVENPVGSTYSSDSQISDGVAEQKADGGSLLSYYKKLIMIRNQNPEIARGEYRALSILDSKVGGFTSTWEGSTVAVLHNTTISAKTVDLADATTYSFTEIAAVIGQEDASLEGTKLTIGAQTSVVLR